jgi:hypothetical protein
MGDRSPANVQRSKRKTVLIMSVIIAAMAVSGVIIAVAVLGIANVTTAVPPVVALSGNVTTTAFGSHPTGILLADQVTNTQVSGSIIGNHYQVFAPNGSHRWKVVVTWQGLAGSGGTCDDGFISYYNNINGFLTQDVSC